MSDTQREEIAKLEALYAAHPEGRVFTHLAEAYRRAGELARARDILGEGLRRHPDYSSAHVVLGRVLSDEGDTTAAMAAFRRVLELDRHNLVALRALGEIAEHQGDTSTALSFYRDLQAMDPSDDALRASIRRLEAEEIAAEAAQGTGAAAAAEAGGHAGGAVEAGARWLDATAGEDDSGTDAREPEQIAGLETFEGADAAADEEAGPIDVSLAGFEASGAYAEADEPSSEEAEVLAGFDWPAGAEAGEGSGDEETADLSGWSFPSADAEEGETDSEFAGEFSGLTLDAPSAGEAGVRYGEPEGFEQGGREDAGPGEVPLAESEAETAAAELAEAEWREGEWAEPGWSAGEEQPSAVEELRSQEEADAEAEAVEGAAAPTAEEGEEDAAFQVSHYAATFLRPSDEPAAGVVTATMADLYARQGFFDRAIQVYRQLLMDVPDDERLRERLAEVESLRAAALATGAGAGRAEVAAETMAGAEADDAPWLGGAGGVAGAEATPYAWADSAGTDPGSGTTVGEYFAGLLSWRPSRGASAPEAVRAAPPEDLEAIEAVLELEDAVEERASQDTLEAGAMEAAIEEWFGGEGGAEEARGAGERRAADGEADADLEMFRSWLQSLKK